MLFPLPCIFFASSSSSCSSFSSSSFLPPFLVFPAPSFPPLIHIPFLCSAAVQRNKTNECIGFPFAQCHAFSHVYIFLLCICELVQICSD